MQFPQRAAIALAFSLLAASPVSASQRSKADAEKLAQRVLAGAIIIDTHADTPQMMLDEGYDLATPDSPYMISIPKLEQGHMGAEFFSIWVDVNWPKQDLVRRALDLIDAVDEQVALHSDVLVAARSAADIERIHRQKKIAILMGV